MCDCADNATTRIRWDAGGCARYESETDAHDDRSSSARRSALLFLDALDESAGTETATAAHGDDAVATTGALQLIESLGD